MSTVIELLDHLRDDAKLGNLFSSVDELSSRVQIANLNNAGQIITAGRNSPSRRGSSYQIQSPRSLYSQNKPFAPHADAPTSPAAASNATPTGTGGFGRPISQAAAAARAQAQARVGASNLKVEELEVPAAPSEPTVLLPPPKGVNDWEHLQQAVNAACIHFSSAGAKLAWKQWALTKEHSAVLVSLFWWAVVSVFQPDNPEAGSIKAHSVAHYSRHHVSSLLQLQSRQQKDVFQELMLGVLAQAVCSMGQQACPRSRHKFGEELAGFLQQQMRRWHTGAVPTDMHPSIEGIDGDPSPAALTLFLQQMQQHTPRGQRAASPPGAPVLSNPPPSASSGTTASSSQALIPDPNSPASPSQPPSASQGTRRASPLGAGQPQPSALSPALSTGPSLATLPSSSNILDSGSSGRFARQGSNAGSITGSASCVSYEGQAAQDKGREKSARAFRANKTSPAMAARFEAHNLPFGDSAVQGLRKEVVGSTQPALRPPLDDEEVSYRAMAKRCCQAAQQAVQRYEEVRSQSSRDVGAIRRQMVEARGAVQSKLSTLQALEEGVKDLSDRLSHWVESDTDRLLRQRAAAARGQRPPAIHKEHYDSPSDMIIAKVEGTGGPSTQAMSAHLFTTTKASELKPNSSRIMEPWYKMRGVESHIRGALSGQRHSSSDVQARATTRMKQREEAAQKLQLRPVEFTRGNYDARIARAARSALNALSLESYNY